MDTKSKDSEKQQPRNPVTGKAFDSDQADNKGQDESVQKMEQLQEAADQEKGVKKPGSQSNSSKQHNNGRGGGK